jgi:hypothetical protein
MRDSPLAEKAEQASEYGCADHNAGGLDNTQIAKGVFSQWNQSGERLWACFRAEQ